MKILLQSEIDAFPPSVNLAQRTDPRNYRRYDSAELKAFKAAMAVWGATAGLPDLKEYEGLPLHIFIGLHWSGWWRQDGGIHKARDYDDRIKFAQDCIFKALGHNDAFIIDGHISKERPEGQRDRYMSVVIGLIDSEYTSYTVRHSCWAGMEAQV